MKRKISYLAGTLILLALLIFISACSNDDTATTTSTTTATSTSTSAPAETTTTTTTTQETTPSTTATSTSTPTTATTTTETGTSTPAETTTATPALDEAAVRAFADDIATTMMQGFSDGDYEKYTRHANETFKDAIMEEQFYEAADVIEEQIGTFVSLTFLSFEIADNYIIVHYSAEYTDATVGVLISFDEDHLVAGQFYE